MKHPDEGKPLMLLVDGLVELHGLRVVSAALAEVCYRRGRVAHEVKRDPQAGSRWERNGRKLIVAASELEAMP